MYSLDSWFFFFLLQTWQHWAISQICTLQMLRCSALFQTLLVSSVPTVFTSTCQPFLLIPDAIWQTYLLTLGVVWSIPSCNFRKQQSRTCLYQLVWNKLVHKVCNLPAATSLALPLLCWLAFFFFFCSALKMRYFFCHPSPNRKGNLKKNLQLFNSEICPFSSIKYIYLK